jgi:asparagine synthase (glutamine-hydrolysing)
MIDKSIGLNTGALFSEIENYNNICDATDLIERMQYLDVKLYLQDEILVKVDRASMSNSLEVRCPILDKNVIEYASKIPSYLKLNNLTTKYILKKILKDKIPPEILNREKQGFTIPARDWFKDELKGFLSDVFNENRIKKEGLFDYKEITKILNEHFTGRADNRREIWTLLIFELWLEKYM